MENQENLLRLMRQCEIDTKKALRLGKKDIVGLMPSWIGLAEHLLFNEVPKEYKVELQAWGGEWKTKIHAHGEATAVVWDSWLFQCIYAIQDASKIDIRLDNLEWWTSVLCDQKVKNQWLIHETEKRIWWSDFLRVGVYQSQEEKTNKLERFNYFLNASANLEGSLFRSVWRSVNAVSNASSRNRDLIIKELIFDKISSWGEERLSKGLEPSTLDMLHPEQSISFWKYIFNSNKVAPFQDNEFAWTTRDLDVMLKNVKVSIAAGPGRGTVHEKLEWLFDKSDWACALMNKPQLAVEFVQMWPKDFKDNLLQRLERSALNIEQSETKQKKVIAL